MKNKILVKKICNIYASDLHFAMQIFPFISKEVEENTIVNTILEKNEEKNIEKIVKNIGLNSQIKNKIKQIDWKKTNICKIKNIFKILEKNIKPENKIDLIIMGTNMFIKKVNKAVDLWIKNQIDIIQNNEVSINIINCFYFEENKDANAIVNTHEYILKTSGIEKISSIDELLQAN